MTIQRACISSALLMFNDLKTVAVQTGLDLLPNITIIAGITMNCGSAAPFKDGRRRGGKGGQHFHFSSKIVVI